MKVVIGTVELDERQLAVIRRAAGYRSGKASRKDVHDFVNKAIDNALHNAWINSLDPFADDADEEFEKGHPAFLPAGVPKT